MHHVHVETGIPGSPKSARNQVERSPYRLLAGLLLLVGCEGSEIVTPFEGFGDTNRDVATQDGINTDDIGDAENTDTPGPGQDITLIDVTGDVDEVTLTDTAEVTSDIDDLDVSLPTCATPADCPTFGNACVSTTCVAGSCIALNAPVDVPCDDGDGCTILDTCEDGACMPGLFICPCTTDESCDPFDDGDLCNGTLVCTPTGCQIDDGTLVLCAAPPSGGCEAVQCNGTTGACETVPANAGSACSEPGPCGETSYCFQGACMPTVLGACDDGNPCTVDTCGATCVNTPLPNGTLCSDADPCTTGDTCTAGDCNGTAGFCPSTCATDADCAVANDADACNGEVRCLGPAGSKACAFDPTSVIVCSPTGGPCEVSFCDPNVGQCTTEDSLDGIACNDGNACTLATTCNAGTCEGGVLLDCEDGNPCTANTCAGGVCLQSPTTGAATCDDGNACTKNDKCLAGLCRAGNNTCSCTTNGDCAGGAGLNLCNGTPVCILGKCELAPSSASGCNAPSPCHTASCNPATGACTVALLPIGSACDDGSACTSASACTAGGCTGTQLVSCDDGNPCTTDVCSPQQGCAAVATPGPCTDGTTCTVGDQCAGGLCIPGQNVCPCTTTSDCAAFDIGNPCDGSLACDAATDRCVAVANSSVVCPTPSEPCTASTCNPATGTCFEYPSLDGSDCSDGSPCTLNDTCVAAQCVGTGLTSCDDQNPCTIDTCLTNGGCKNDATVSVCDDGNPCTVGDACAAGACEPGAKNPLCSCITDADCATLDDGNACNGTLECVAGACALETGSVVICAPSTVSCKATTCDPETGLCGAVDLPNASACTDFNQCTTGDTCAGGTCSGTPLSCDDESPCTTDTCVPSLGCQYALTDATCNDGDVCTINDTCVAGTCNGLINVCDCTTNADCADFNDANLCVGEYLCTPAGCVPGLEVLCAPTLDVSGCLENTCDPSDGACKTLPVSDGAPCSDGDVCTVDDTCAAGSCAGSSPAPSDCDDGNSCTADTCSPFFGCLNAPVTGACSDGIACTLVDVCVSGTCRGNFTACNDANPCTTDACGPTGCTNEDNVLPCSDGDACTINDGCAGGVCEPGVAKNCDDDNACTLDGICNVISGNCAPATNLVGTPCSDDNACTLIDLCNAGVCGNGAETACNDANPCTTDSCVPATGCSNVPNTNPCNDGDLCTATDVCGALGVCAGTVLDCDDENECTTDACTGSGCTNLDNVLPCSDGDFCTVGDGCAGGSCLPGGPTSCDDVNDCTTDGVCAPATGICAPPAALTGPVCSDGACLPGGACCCLGGLCLSETTPGSSCD